MDKILRYICMTIIVILFANLFVPCAYGAKPIVTMDGLPSTVKAPKSSTVAYQLRGYVNDIYEPNAVWSISGGDASGYNLNPQTGTLTITPEFSGSYIEVRCTLGSYYTNKTLYVGERSLIQDALAWVGTGWAQSVAMPQQAVDGNSGTYWSAGTHTVGSTAKLCIDTNSVKYNKVKLEYNHIINSSQTTLYASDTVTSEVPTQSGIASSIPALGAAVTLYDRLQPNYEETIYVDVDETTMKYLMFSSRTESNTKTPFRLNEISLYYTMPGDMEITGVDNEVSVPKNGATNYRLDAVLYDSIGQQMDISPFEVSWAVSAPEGVVFDDEKNILTVSDFAKIGKATITAVCNAEGVVITATKNVTIEKGKILVRDELEREVNRFDKAGNYYASVENGSLDNIIIFTRYQGGQLAEINIGDGDETIEFYVEPEDNQELKVFYWGTNYQPAAPSWVEGKEQMPEENIYLLEKNFQNNGTSGLSGFYRADGFVTAADGRMNASVDKHGIWTHLNKPFEESAVIDASIGVNVPAELYIRDSEGNEILYDLSPSDTLQNICMLFNRSKNICMVNDIIEIDISGLSDIYTIGIRAQNNINIIIEHIRCYSGTKRNDGAALNEYAYFERTPVESEFVDAKGASNNMIVMAIDYDIASFYGDRVKLALKPKDMSGVAYIPVEAIGLLGGAIVTQNKNSVTAKFANRILVIPIYDGYIKAASLAELVGKNLYYNNGIITVSSESPIISAQELQKMLHYYRPMGGEVLESVKNLGARPRILANQDVFDRASNTIATDPMVAGWYEKLLATANSYFGKPVAQYEVVSGRLLAVSNTVFDRVSNLGFVYRLTGDERYAERAWQELSAAAAFSDWHPAHFLDVGQMSFAFAVGYDWLNDYLTANQKRILVKAFEEKGLAEFVKAINTGTGWAASSSNWNSWVRNGVLSCVLSMAEDLNNIGAAKFAIEKGMTGLEILLKEFAPIGAWYEGTAYWEAAVRFLVQLIDSLEYSTGRYWGYDNLPGFEKTRYYSAMLTGSGLTFNFSDTTVTRDNPAIEFWLSNRFNDPGLTNLRVQNINTYNLATGLMDILWYIPTGNTALPVFDNDVFYESIDVAAFHNGWSTTSLFAAVKGADIGASHFHYDGGNFVFDMGGQRFAYELGRDGYATTPNTSARNLSYKVRAEGHNVLLINPSADPGQRSNTKAHIISYEENTDERHAIVDLTQLYEDRGLNDGYTGKNIKRGFKVYKESDTILVQDEVHLTKSSKMYWFMHTKANITVSEDGRSATLTLNGKTITAQIIGDENAKFLRIPAWILPTTPELPNQGKNNAFTKLAIYWDSVKDTTYAVKFTSDGESGDEPLVALENW
ncbi:MAG: heparinase II/III-family protein [Firmicutes bacterium]|nr:heparinase II/III-family protein [Bacillota bacterium]